MPVDNYMPEGYICSFQSVIDAVLFFALSFHFSGILLTLKMPRRPASENVVCLCRLLNILGNFSNLFLLQTGSVDPDQTAATGAV